MARPPSKALRSRTLAMPAAQLPEPGAEVTVVTVKNVGATLGGAPRIIIRVCRATTAILGEAYGAMVTTPPVAATRGSLSSGECRSRAQVHWPMSTVTPARMTLGVPRSVGQRGRRRRVHGRTVTTTPAATALRAPGSGVLLGREIIHAGCQVHGSTKVIKIATMAPRSFSSSTTIPPEGLS